MVNPVLVTPEAIFLRVLTQAQEAPWGLIVRAPQPGDFDKLKDSFCTMVREHMVLTTKQKMRIIEVFEGELTAAFAAWERK